MTEEITVYWDDCKVDVTKFVKRHPAGEDLILEYRDKNIRGAFEKVGHSAEAKNILFDLIKKTAPESEVTAIEEIPRMSFLEHAKKKLITSEDPYHLHKTLGIISLVNYFYRYFYVWVFNWNLGYMDFSYFNLFTLLCHLALTTSSLVFHVLPHRNVREPLVIYEEYRLHSILFTIRSVGVTLLAWSGVNIVSVWTFVLLIHLTVDKVTVKHGTPGVTAVRNDGRGKLWYLKPMRLGYAYYQFVAIASHLAMTPMLGDMGFNTLAAIQSSAFLMTLRRKNIIIWQMHMLWYSLALFLSLSYIWEVHGLWIFAFAFVCYYLRIVYSCSKYLVWSIFLIMYGAKLLTVV